MLYTLHFATLIIYIRADPPSPPLPKYLLAVSRQVRNVPVPSKRGGGGGRAAGGVRREEKLKKGSGWFACQKPNPYVIHESLQAPISPTTSRMTGPQTPLPAASRAAQQSSCRLADVPLPQGKEHRSFLHSSEARGAQPLA